jgi:FMN phosphatase YigB (HAD superfamily)
MPVAILTHGTQHWGEKVTEHLGMTPTIILGLDHKDINFEMKHQTKKPFLAVADALGLSPRHLAMVEDSASNLTQAFTLGMQTVLVHWGKPPAQKPAHVDMMMATIGGLGF